MKKLEEMTLKEKLGQCVAFGFSGYELNYDIVRLIEKYHVGNIILFARNFESPEQLRKLNQDLDKLIRESCGVTPLIMIDQEGGMVTRISHDATFFPGAMTIAASSHKAPYQLGYMMGEEMLAMGVNQDLAPVIDPNDNKDNPSCVVRSYADNPEGVSKFALETIKGLQESGVIATAKHFPGYGACALDAHLALPVLDKKEEEVERMELVSFKNVINAHIGCIMSAHTIFNCYDSEHPSTISSAVLKGVLRDKLGYNGVVISDCMEMEAINKLYGVPRGAVLGLKAGLDIALVSHTPMRQFDTMKALYNALDNGEISEAEIDEKVTRILALKEAYEEAYQKKFRDLSDEDFKAVVYNEHHKALAQSVVDGSLTKVRGKDFYPDYNTLVIATDPNATTGVEENRNGYSITKSIKHSNSPLRYQKMSVKPSEEEIKAIIESSKYFNQVVVCTYNSHMNKEQARLVRALHHKVKDLYVISTRNPYDILDFEEVENYYCVYEYTPMSCNTITKWLTRDIIPTGHCPVDINRDQYIGASAYCGIEPYTVKDTCAYLEMLAKNRIKYLFVSAHMPEMKKDFSGELKEILDKAHSLGMQVSIDVSRPMMDNFTIPEGITLRLDWGFSDEEMVELSQHQKLELNASVVSKEKLEKLVFLGLNTNNVVMSHNFYPKKGTGLSLEETQRRNEMFHALGFTVQGFIPSSNMKRPPCYDGLPTVEAMRYQDTIDNVIEARLLGFDIISFGDAYASEEEIKEANRKVKEDSHNFIEVPIAIYDDVTDIEKAQLLAQQSYRIDAAGSFIRCGLRSTKDIEHKGISDRIKGSITIDNKLYGRYQGEVCLQKEYMTSDQRVNVVGYSVASQYILDAIKPGTKFRYRIVKEVKR